MKNNTIAYVFLTIMLVFMTFIDIFYTYTKLDEPCNNWLSLKVWFLTDSLLLLLTLTIIIILYYECNMIFISLYLMIYVCKIIWSLVGFIQLYSNCNIYYLTNIIIWIIFICYIASIYFIFLIFIKKNEDTIRIIEHGI